MNLRAARNRGLRHQLDGAALEQHFDNGAVQIGAGETVRSIPASTVVWTAGVKPASALQYLAVQKVKGRLLTQSTLELPDWSGVYAVGDCAAIPDP